MIKKYPNRRLYDTGQSRYITCQELATMIKQGAAPGVTDKGGDVTAEVYATIVLDLTKRGRIATAALLPLILAAMADPVPARAIAGGRRA